jgi:hypothetical protein
MMMFPRFFRVCCKDHLTDEDVWLTDRLRRDINREIREGIEVRGLGVETVEWWALSRASEDMALSEVRKNDCLDSDNVDLTMRLNSMAAGILCNRLLERMRSKTAAIEVKRWRRM